MLLAQIDIEPWHVYTGAFVAITYATARAWIAISKNKSEERRADQKEQREISRDEAHTTFLQRIATSNEQTATSVATLNQKLENEKEIRDIIHKQNLEGLRMACKYRESK